MEKGEGEHERIKLSAEYTGRPSYGQVNRAKGMPLRMYRVCLIYLLGDDWPQRSGSASCIIQVARRINGDSNQRPASDFREPGARGREQSDFHGRPN